MAPTHTTTSRNYTAQHPKYMYLHGKDFNRRAGKKEDRGESMEGGTCRGERCTMHRRINQEAYENAGEREREGAHVSTFS